MTTDRQVDAAQRNVEKGVRAAARMHTITALPEATRRDFGRLAARKGAAGRSGMATADLDAIRRAS